MALNGLYPASVKPGIPKLGIQPDGWRKVVIRDIVQVVERPCNVSQNLSYQLIIARRNRGGIEPRCVLNGKQIKTKTQFYVKAGDFLISRRQIVHGACGVVPPYLDGAIVSNEYAVLVPRDGLTIEYLGFLCHTNYFQQTCFHASVGVAVEKMVFRIDQWLRYKFYLPPVKEQHIISKILSAAELSIDQITRLIEAKNILKKGLMQQLLTGKKRFREFDGQDWTEYKLGKIFKERVEIGREDLPLLSVTADNGVVDRDDLIKRDTSSSDKSKYKRVAPGDIAYNTMRMWQGRSALSDKDGIVSPAYTVCVPQEEVDGQFAEHLFRIPEIIYKFRRYSQGLVDDTLNLKYPAFAEIKLAFPCKQEQCRIANVLNSISKEINLLERQQEALKQQKKGLMQKLLTGQVRVKI
ncbi:restriction endonuclease subunit S [bacterium]|nr:restriction endonuclease subunit S [bacterium]